MRDKGLNSFRFHGESDGSSEGNAGGVDRVDQTPEPEIGGDPSGNAVSNAAGTPGALGIGPILARAATPAPTLVTTAGSNLKINLNWDAYTSSAPAGFTADLIAAARFLETQFTDAVTININVGYGEIGNGGSIGGALGESLTYLTQVSYARRVVGHRYFPFMNYEMPAHVYADAGPRLKRLLGFLQTGPYG